MTLGIEIRVIALETSNKNTVSVSQFKQYVLEPIEDQPYQRWTTFREEETFHGERARNLYDFVRGMNFLRISYFVENEMNSPMRKIRAR